MSGDASGSEPTVAPRTGAVVAALAAVYLIWGSTYLAIRVGLDGFPPFVMGALRFLAAGFAMYAFLRWRGHAPPTRAQWRNLAVLSVFLLVTGNGLVNVAEQTVSSGLAAVAVASMPLWAALFGRLRGQHPTRGELLGLAIGFLGVVWLNIGSEMRASTVGMIALLLAPISWAWGSVWSRGRDLPGPAMSTAAQMSLAGIFMAAIAAALGERIVAMPSPSATLAVAYLAVFGSIVAFSAYVWLLDHVRPALATSYAYVNPPIAVLLGAVLLGERFGAQSIGAMAVILVGVAIVVRAKAKPKS
jgi:drug/metabolite transporter (DMT)-like permease